MQRTRVLLVDDHAVLRAGLRLLLAAEPDLLVVGEAETGEEALERTPLLRPHVVVMDLAMPGAGGLEAIRALATTAGGPRVLVLTMHGDEYLLPALDAGATGYLSKRRADVDLLAAIRTVARGDVYLEPAAARLLATRIATRDRGTGSTLSQREREVLLLTAEGFSASEAGERLGLSPKTVETYRHRVMEKLQFHHRSELVHFAVRQGMLSAV